MIYPALSIHKKNPSLISFIHIVNKFLKISQVFFIFLLKIVQHVCYNKTMLYDKYKYKFSHNFQYLYLLYMIKIFNVFFR